VGDALVDAGVEGGSVGRGRVFHRLCARQVLHVEEVHTHLTCDVAVPEQHGDVEDGASGEECEGAGAGLDSTELLEVTQFRPGQNAVSARFEFRTVVVHKSTDDFHRHREVGRHHRGRHMHPVRQQRQCPDPVENVRAVEHAAAQGL
jgi:hypothetical protein